VGRWIGTDPKKQHWSPYTYGSNNPIVRIDPDGQADVAVGWNVSGSAVATGRKGVNLNININSGLEYFANKTDNQFAKAWLQIVKMPFDAIDWAVNGFKNVPKQDAISIKETTGIGGGLIAGASAGLNLGLSIGNPGDYTMGLKGTFVPEIGGWAQLTLNYKNGSFFPSGVGISGSLSVGAEAGIGIEKTVDKTVK
jgi:hypothetical protein